MDWLQWKDLQWLIFFWLHVRAVDLGGHGGQWQIGLGKDSCNNQDACYQ